MESSEITLSSLPLDIIHEICDHLANQDVLEFRLVSKVISPKIPRPRLKKILSKRTLLFTDSESIRLTHLLASCSDEELANTRHLVFDLANPYVGLVEISDYYPFIWGYDEHTKSKMLIFSRIYRERTCRGTSLWQHKDTRKVGKPRGVPMKDHQEFCYDELYKILEQNIKTPIRPGPYPWGMMEYHKKKSPFGFNKWAYFDILTQAFKFFPNLSILEFKLRDKPEGPGFRIPPSWVRHNQSLKYFLADNPELNDIPCCDWLCSYGSLIDFGVAYPAVLSAAAKARCHISEIRASQFPMLGRDKFGADIHQFGQFSYGSDPCIACPDSGITFTDLDTYISDYNYTFANLTKLEIFIRRRRSCSSTDVSPLFLAMLPNVQELTIRGSQRLGEKIDNSGLPLDIVLPKLRILKLIYVALNPFALLNLLRTNQNSLKEVICTLSLEMELQHYGILDFLRFVRTKLNLTTCQIDFLTYGDWSRREYVLVDIQGTDWKYDTDSKYRVARVMAEEIMAVDEGIKDEVKWHEYSNWADFCFHTTARRLECSKSRWEGMTQCKFVEFEFGIGRYAGYF
ncbi:hypothetical protein TWF718_002175 [Orbilia javanica]|uniref:F-box domain-containing protein n=1 Tax=Orbilia javanica TaxID=47235 RepID=A0AAN8MTR9_9PEZI